MSEPARFGRKVSYGQYCNAYVEMPMSNGPNGMKGLIEEVDLWVRRAIRKEKLEEKVRQLDSTRHYLTLRVANLKGRTPETEFMHYPDGTERANRVNEERQAIALDLAEVEKTLKEALEGLAASRQELAGWAEWTGDSSPTDASEEA